VATELRVKDFTYYPLLGSGCAFRVENRGPVNTYHRCPRIARRQLEDYKFCEKHAQLIERALKGGESK
jgi:hypothetical protein